ncbi:MAG: plasmid recombination protein [Oscillospiraceae bacterium]|nr:plasmid recombination protein [Oscillospiraceae bacterium]
MAAYVFLTVTTVRVSRINIAYHHNARIKDVYSNTAHVDRTRSCLNYHFIEPQGDYIEEVDRKIKEAGAKARTNCVRMMEGIIAPSPNWIKAKDPDEQREFFEHCMDFVSEWIGEKRLIDAVVHMDEETPHMHFDFVPITEDGRVSRMGFIGDELDDMTKLQDRFYKHISSKYPDIHRGIPKRKTHQRHLPMYLFKSAADLNMHYKELYDAVQDISIINSKEQKDHVMELLSQYTVDYSAIMYRIRNAETYLSQVEDEARQREKQLQRYKEEIKGKDLEIARLKEDKEELKEDKKELEKLIAEVPAEIMDKIRGTNKDRKERNEDI